MQTGTRFSQAVSPRDLTGTRQRQLIAEKARREAAEKAAPSDLEKARLAGFDQGWAAAERFYLEVLEAADATAPDTASQ